MADDWAFKPWGAEKKQKSVFDPVQSHTDFGSSPSSSWAFESSSPSSSWGASTADSGKSSWAYESPSSASSGSSNSNWAFSVGESNRSFAFGGSASGGWNQTFTASCETHYLDLKARERGMSSNFNSDSSWAFSNVNSLNEVRGRLGEYDARRSGSNSHFSPFDSSPSSFNPFAPTKLKKF